MNICTFYKKNIKENEKGITLIALVVTMIILLLFAGITLGLIDGENGIISKTKQAVLIHKEAESTENEKIDTLSQILDSESDSSYNPSQGVNCNCGDSLENINTKISQLEEKITFFENNITNKYVEVTKPTILYGTGADDTITGGWTGTFASSSNVVSGITKNRIHLKQNDIISADVTLTSTGSYNSSATLGISSDGSTTKLNASSSATGNPNNANVKRTISVTVATEGDYNIVVTLDSSRSGYSAKLDLVKLY